MTNVWGRERRDDWWWFPDAPTDAQEPRQRPLADLYGITLPPDRPGGLRRLWLALRAMTGFDTRG